MIDLKQEMKIFGKVFTYDKVSLKDCLFIHLVVDGQITEFHIADFIQQLKLSGKVWFRGDIVAGAHSTRLSAVTYLIKMKKEMLEICTKEVTKLVSEISKLEQDDCMQSVNHNRAKSSFKPAERVGGIKIN